MLSKAKMGGAAEEAARAMTRIPGFLTQRFEVQLQPILGPCARKHPNISEHQDPGVPITPRDTPSTGQ